MKTGPTRVLTVEMTAGSTASSRPDRCDDAGRDARYAVCPAPVVAAVEFVEIGLQVPAPDRAGVGPEQPALELRDRPVAALHGIIFAPLGPSPADPGSPASAAAQHRFVP